MDEKDLAGAWMVSEGFAADDVGHFVLGDVLDGFVFFGLADGNNEVGQLGGGDAGELGEGVGEGEIVAEDVVIAGL